MPHSNSSMDSGHTPNGSSQDFDRDNISLASGDFESHPFKRTATRHTVLTSDGSFIEAQPRRGPIDQL
jgi:hypothetical protein